MGLADRGSLSHPAFAPFEWLQMHNDTATLVDFKFRFLCEILLHFEFIAYRSDADMTVTRSQVNPNALRLIQDNSTSSACNVSLSAGTKCRRAPLSRAAGCTAAPQEVGSWPQMSHGSTSKFVRP